ncbi:MAG: hypothetical protein QXG34_03670, partial [Candidatus Bathyarchaeia archaeon]
SIWLMRGMVEVRITEDYAISCDFDVVEDSDWDYARNKHVLIREGLLEYSTSSFDAPVQTRLGVMHGGNRDLPWQGLLAGPINNILYKVIDALYYRALDAESLKPLFVSSRRNSASYVYIDENNEYYIVDVFVEAGRSQGFLSAYSGRPTIFLPIFDLRNAESKVQPNYTLYEKNGVLIVESTGAPIKIEITGFERIVNLNLTLEWIYKLGDGFRRLDDGKVLFIKHAWRVRAPIALISAKGILRVRVPLPENIPLDIRDEIGSNLKRLHLALREHHPELPPKIVNAVLLRLDRLMSFGIPLDSLFAPEAGSMWFRRIWVRDLLEGLRWNMLTYAEIFGLFGWLNNLVRRLMKVAYENNGLRIFVKSGDYVSDAIPQLINVATLLYERTHKRILLRESAKLMLKAYKMLRSEEGFSGCNLHNGLIICKAYSSWIDVLYPINGLKWPTRLPLEWIGRVSPEDKFALVEVNSLLLESLNRLIGHFREIEEKPPKELYEFRDELLYGYEKWFLRDESLPPITIDPVSGLRDDTKSSLGVVSVTSLKDIFYDERKIMKIWGDIEHLLVRRKLVELGNGCGIFGLLVRKVDEKPYLGDLEYHGTVVWPRDTPYLIEIMKSLSMEKEIYDILINNLDHMISEGAIGYVNELFSLPLGENPSPAKRYSSNPVPVKNFAQYWSHWCDPYIQYFLEYEVA